MRPESKNLPELIELVSALCDDQLNEQGYARLEQLLRSDRDCLRFYVEYLDEHGELQARVRRHEVDIPGGDSSSQRGSEQADVVASYDSEGRTISASIPSANGTNAGVASPAGHGPLQTIVLRIPGLGEGAWLTHSGAFWFLIGTIVNLPTVVLVMLFIFTRSSTGDGSALDGQVRLVRDVSVDEPVLILNPSFEQPELTFANPFVRIKQVPGWQMTGDGIAGVQALEVGQHLTSIPDGKQCAIIQHDNPGGMYQTLEAKVGDYQMYKLTAWAGMRIDELSDEPFGAVMELYAAESGQLLVSASATVEKGRWQKLQAVYRPSNDSPLGDHLRIVLRRGWTNVQIVLDHVELVGVPVDAKR